MLYVTPPSWRQQRIWHKLQTCKIENLKALSIFNGSRDFLRSQFCSNTVELEKVVIKKYSPCDNMKAVKVKCLYKLIFEKKKRLLKSQWTLQAKIKTSQWLSRAAASNMAQRINNKGWVKQSGCSICGAEKTKLAFKCKNEARCNKSSRSICLIITLSTFRRQPELSAWCLLYIIINCFLILILIVDFKQMQSKRQHSCFF